MVYNRQKIIDIALVEVNYLEKRSNAQLDNKTANAGSANFTKYARDLDKLGFYNGKKQGQAWCDMFFDWCMVKAYGKEAALKLTYQPVKAANNYGAGCQYSRQYYANKKRLYSNPKPGDQIFFWNSTKTKVVHTGLVYKTDNKKVYTVEGNTSGASGVIANGGGVCKKSYILSYNRIAGYGRPAYTKEEKTVNIELTILENDNKGNQVKTIQRLFNALGYNCGKVDGEFGNKTLKVVKAFQKAKGLTADGVVGAKTWNALLK